MISICMCYWYHNNVMNKTNSTIVYLSSLDEFIIYNNTITFNNEDHVRLDLYIGGKFFINTSDNNIPVDNFSDKKLFNEATKLVNKIKTHNKTIELLKII